MRVRTTIAGAGLSAMLTVTGFGAMTVLASTAISACSTSGTPTPTTGTTGTTGSTTPSTTNPVTTPTVTSTTTVTANPNTTSTPLPSAAPATGGGGTAGVQHGLLFAVGGAAVLAGAGSIAYRRKLLKNR
jgi:hypothetical protein